MKINVFTASVIVAFSGFLFGFDSVVISGANLPLRSLWEMSDWFHGVFIMSSSSWGTVVGAIIGGYPTDKWGRKSTLLISGVVFVISAVGSALAMEPYSFSFFRFIGGLVAGCASIAAPAYISEVSSSHNRGRLGMFFQLFLVMGILFAQVSNYLIKELFTANDWRWMLGVELVPALLFTIGLLYIPESHKWLSLVKRKQAEAVASTTKTFGGLFSGAYRKQLLLVFFICFFNQASGISFILFYAPEILEKAGFGASDSLLSTTMIGLVNLLFTIVSFYVIDRYGRKHLMYFGSFGYVFSLVMVAFGFYIDTHPMFQLTFLLLFIASHAVGQGAVIWVFISEIFPTSVRAFGQSFGSGVLNVLAACMTLLGATVINQFSPSMIFGFLAVLMVFQGLFVYFMMPETKGVPLDSMNI